MSLRYAHGDDTLAIYCAALIFPNSIVIIKQLKLFQIIFVPMNTNFHHLINSSNSNEQKIFKKQILNIQS